MDEPLTSSDRQRLRRAGRELPVAAQVGKAGVTAAVASLVSALLTDRELVKVRIGPSDKAGRREAAAQLAQRTGSILVGVLGRTALLYRRIDN